jgi:hypothetical protein
MLTPFMPQRQHGYHQHHDHDQQPDEVDWNMEACKAALEKLYG